MERATGTSGRRERGAAPPAVVVALGLLAGALAGVVLEGTGVVDPLGEPAPVVVRIDRVPVLDCPDGVPIASLARGDRVLVMARSGDAEWLEIRSPVDAGRPAWVSSAAVDGDGGAVLRLPERSCDDGPTTTTASTSTTTSSTTTTSTSTTTTSTTTTSTTLPPPPPTTTTLPNVPPLLRLTVIGSISGQPPGPTSTSSSLPASTTSTTLPPGAFFYVHAQPSACPGVAAATVDAVDPDGVAAVHLRWTTGAGGASGQQPMVQQGTTTRWTLALQFPSAAVPAPDESRAPAFSVVAIDGRGAETVSPLDPVSAFRVFRSDTECGQ